MPIYEYKCEGCGNEFEKLIRRTADESTLACPGCGDRHLEQKWSTFAAKADSGGRAQEMGGGCPAGMCQTPGMCGRN